MELETACRGAVEIRDTAVGSGVFALSLFGAREIVSEITGQVVFDVDYESDYCMDLGKGALLEPQTPYRFLNHSCEPNCELVLWKKRKHEGRKHARLWLQTLRTIEPNEELTIDYAWPPEAAIPCHCRSRLCRGWIVHAAALNDLQLEW